MSAVVEINNGDDFIINLIIKDDSQVVLPYDQINWEAIYYTSLDYPLVAKSVDGVLSSNCEIDGDTIKIFTNNHNWGTKGTIYRTIKVAFIDGRFIDGKADVSKTGILTSHKII